MLLWCGEMHQHTAGRAAALTIYCLGLYPVLLFRVMTRWTCVAGGAGG